MSTMKRIRRGGFALAILLLPVAFLRAADPVVDSVICSQRAGTKLVDIEYRVTDADGDEMTITVSGHDYESGVDVPINTLSGDGADGASVTSGVHHLVWDAGADWTGKLSDRFRITIRAADTNGGEAPEGFVLIPAGTNSGTNPLAEGGSYDSTWYPETYSLTVSAFYMSKYETSKAKWDEVRAWAASHGYTGLSAGGGKGPTHPVHSVNWYDVVKWCNAWSEKEGRTPCYTVSGNVYKTGEYDDVVCDMSANGYRLPTDTEWEYAARGGLSGKRFPWGDTITHSQANYCSDDGYSYDISPTRGYHPTYNDGTSPYTSPAGSFAANGYGLYDMAGNVWEWCWDWYPGYVGSIRVRRGGGWCYHADFCRSGFRYWDYPDRRIGNIGFRVCSAAPVQ